MHHAIPEEIQLIVPYLCGELRECAATDFEAYAKDFAFDVDDLVSRGDDFTADELIQIAAFIQEWLVFGLFRKILRPSGISVQLDDFVDFVEGDTQDAGDGSEDGRDPIEDSGEVESSDRNAHGEETLGETDKYVRMDLVSIYILYWIAEETHRSDDARRSRLWTEHLQTFSRVNVMVNKLIIWRRENFPLRFEGEDGPSTFDLVVLQVVLLAESLFDACQRLFTTEEASIEWELDNAIRWWLLDGGWCVGEVSVLQKKLIHSTSLYIVSTFKRKGLQRDHSRCDSHSCRADQLDEDIYETRHAEDGCSCAFVGESSGSPSRTVSILQDNAIPVIQVLQSSSSNDDEISISVRPSTEGPYVAISHVWSDGLGNPKQNMLPRCQLLRLQKYANDLYADTSKSVAFWIDTICVPLQSELRKTAISLMASTYGAADQVLVIDDWLVQNGFLGIEREDMLKVKSCTWSQRLWTLQESMLAQLNSLWFQTRNGPFNERDIFGGLKTGLGAQFMSDMIGSEADGLQQINTEAAKSMYRSIDRYEEIKERAATARPGGLVPFQQSVDPKFPWEQDDNMLRIIESWYAHDFVWIEGRNYLTEMRHRGMGDTAVLQANRTAIVGYSMRFRSTSRAEDEPICFATLLGQNPRPLFQEPTVEGRMRIVASNMKYLNVMALFSDMPRIDVDGLRWAPVSFRAEVRGKAKSPGLTFTKFAEVRPEGLLVRLEGIGLASIDTGDKALGTKFNMKLEALNMSVTTRRSIKRLSEPTSKRLVLVIRSESARLSRGGSDAVLVAVHKSEDNVSFAELLSLCSIKPSSEPIDHSVEPITGTMLPETRWCIG